MNKGRPAKAKPKPTTPKPNKGSHPAPDGLSPRLAKAWARLIDDLGSLGSIMPSDADRLSNAFEHLSNGERIQDAMDDALARGEATNISKLQSALASATRLADGIISSVTRDVRARPAPKESDDWLSRTTT